MSLKEPLVLEINVQIKNKLRRDLLLTKILTDESLLKGRMVYFAQKEKSSRTQ